ncbi:MAG TPA: protein kinase, partial [Vineibacter sp.]|nr:protein kinase [Vineibacter sp.]
MTLRGDETDPFGPLPAGTRIGKYEIVQTLGQGGFGITYRARDDQLRRDVAVKEYLPTSFAMRRSGGAVLPRSTETAQDFVWGRGRFLDEARTLASLEAAPGIANVYDFMEANGTAYMMMTLVRGETLEARLKREGRLPPPAIEQLLYPLLDGLERVHEAGFLHRDIKPANVIIDTNGRPTLIDFGASRLALQGRTQSMTAVYTPGYAAFEQVTSAKQGPWTDIYALAGTLYHAVTGLPPQGVLERMAEDVLVPAMEAGKSRYASSLLAAIDAGLRLKASERPQNIAEWRRLLWGMGSGKQDDSLGAATRNMRRDSSRSGAPTAASGRRRSASLWLTAGAAALALAGGGIWWIVRPAVEPGAVPGRSAVDTPRTAEQETARRVAEEKAAAEAVARRKAEETAARAEADARQRAEDDARAKAEAQRRDDEARRAAEAQARAEAAAREKAEADARAAAEEAGRRRAAEEKARAEAAAREKAEADAHAAEDDARRRAAEDTRKAEADRAKAEADAKRQAETAEAALRLSEEDRKRIQVALTALGYNTLGDDGNIGPRTRQMIAAWQKSQGAVDSGFLTAAQYAALRQQAGAALLRYDEEQRKLRDDKRKAEEDSKRRQNEDAKRRAEEDQRRAAAAAGPDGRWSGEIRCETGFVISMNGDIAGGRGVFRPSQSEVVVLVRGTAVSAAVTSSATSRGTTLTGSLSGALDGGTI